MAVELGQGYISVTARTDGMPSAISKGLSGAQNQADSAGQGMGSRLADGMSKTLKVGAVAAGVAVGGILTAAVTKGMGRLIEIENAESKLAGLGHSAATVTKIMDNALSSVQGTAFGLGEAASIAASAVAAGIKPGQDLERTLKLTGDAATIAGVDITSMGAIFNKVAASNKVQGVEIMQLNKAGIPIVKMLGAELGKTTDEILSMTRKGQVSFEDFQNAMERGLGGAALESGKTFQGALANMGAALGRFGAELVGPAFRKGPATFGLLTAAIDKGTEAIKPFTAAFSSWLDSDAIPKTVAFATGVRDAFNEFRNSDFAIDTMSRLSSVLGTTVEAYKSMWPAVKQVASSLSEAAGAASVSTWSILLSTVESTAVIFDRVFGPILRTTASLMERNQGVVNALAIGFLAFKTIPAIMGRVSGAFAPIGAAAGRARVGVSGFAGAMRDSWRYAGQANPQVGAFGRAMTIAGANGRAAMGSLGGAVRGVVSAVGGLSTIAVAGAIAAIIGVTSEISKTNRQNDLLTTSALNAAGSMGHLTSAFIKGEGKIDSEVFSAVNAELNKVQTNLKETAGTAPGLWSQFTGAAGDVAGWFRGQAQAGTDAHKAQIAVAESAKDASGALDRLGWSQEQLTAGISGSESEWNALKSALIATGDGGAEAVAQLEPLRANFERLERLQRTVTPGSMEVAAAFKEIGNEAASADTKTSALKRALDAMAGGVPDLAAATDDFGKVLRDVDSATGEAWDKTKGWGDELVKADGSINVMSENGSQLLSMLMDMRDTTVGVAMAGGDMNEAWAENETRLQALADAAGLPLPMLKEIAAQLGFIPSAIDTAVSVSGAGAVTAELGGIKAQFDNIADGDEKKITVAALTDEARAAIEGVEYQVNELDGGEFEIIPRTDEAEGRLAALIGMIGSIPPDKVLDVSAPGADGVIDALNTIGIKVHSDNEKGIVIEDNSPETIAKLKALNITTDTLQDGTVVITDNVDDVKKNVNGLNLLKTSSTHTVTMQGTTLGGLFLGGATGADGGLRGAGIPDGMGLQPKAFANGKLPDEALIAPGRGSGLVQWAEGETGGEAFIPLAESKRPRSLSILSEVASRFGMRLEAFADGGIRNALSAARSKEGNLYSWGGVGPSNFDCSGFVGFIQQIVMGISEAAAAGKRLYTTNSLLGGSTAGLVRGYNAESPFNVGVSNDHMAATVGGVNVESGGASSPSSSGVGPGRAGALDSQFGTQFHLPVEMVEGGYEQGAVYAATGPVWSEKDELDLKSARVAITQAQEAAAKARSNPKKSSADIEQAELKVARAEQKVADIEGKKEGRTGVQALTAPPAPPLMGGMDEDAIGLRQAELAVTDAQLARDKAYADPASLSSDKEKSDLAVYSAQNRLVETQKQLAESNNALAATGGVKGAAQRFASDAVGIGYDAFWDIIGFQEPRWFQMDAPTVPGKPNETYTVEHAMRDVPAFFSDAELANQNPSSDMDEWLRRQRPALHDEGGWLEPGLTMNLTRKPEPVLNPEQFANLKRIANLDQAPQSREPVSEVHHHYHLTDVKQIDHLRRQERQRQLIQRGG